MSSLGYTFRDVSLLQLALTHPSVVHERGGRPHNQRLEFLGDAVLQLALTRELFIRFPDHDEGSLTKARAHLVNQASLAEQSRRLQVAEQLILSHAEDVNGGRARNSILADALEAIIGAVFLDGGYEASRDVVLRLFSERMLAVEAIPMVENPKGELQELLQARFQQSPEYTVLSAIGPDHDREFECAVLHQGEELGRGKGRSKKLAESDAAADALRKLADRKDDAPADRAG